MSLVFAILLMILLLLLKGFFSGSEIALVSADKIKLRHKQKQGHRGADLALKLFQRPEVILSTTLVGTNVSTITLTTIGALVMIEYFGASGEFYAFLLLTPLLLVLGEIVPKSVYQQRADALTPVIVYPLRYVSLLFYPIVFVFSRIARVAARLTGSGRNGQPFFITREQLRTVLEMADHGAGLGTMGRHRIRRVIRFAETTVAEAMIPIAEATVIDRDATTQHAIDLIRKHGYNRLPVYAKSANNVVGIVTLSTWDLMEPDLVDKPLASLIKPALYISPLQTIDQLIPMLQQRSDHMAVVVNEFGTAVGIITREDIVEEVVGEIDVGYDFEEYLPKPRRIYEKVAEDTFIMDSRLPISEANEILRTTLPATEFHTVGGLVLARLRHIPKVGEYISEEGYRFTVVEANERAILKLRVETEAVGRQ